MLPQERKRKLLVAYNDSSGSSHSSDSSSECEDSDDKKIKVTDKRLRVAACTPKPLPLPSAVLGMFREQGTKDAGSSSETKHQGRIRTFEHFEGDWASFVFIPVITGLAMEQVLQKMLNTISSKLPDIHAMPFTDLHISVSRTASIRHYWIEPMVQKLRNAISGIERFTCCLDLVEVYTNDEKSRTFIGIRILIGEEKIQSLVSEVDKVFQEFGLDKYYKNPRFHLSFAWHLSDVTSSIDEDMLVSLQDILHEDPIDTESDWRRMPVGRLCFKTGNKTFHLPLK